jgi:hypothetical protein
MLFCFSLREEWGFGFCTKTFLLVLQFVTVIQALITAAKQLRCLQFTKGKVNVEEGPRGVRSPLLQRLIATASSMTMSEHAAQLLLALNTDAAASGDKLNLFLCEGGRFPQVYMPIHVADELLFINISKSRK